ncbi:MAG: M20/M25/M40 family metallo-hydrolase [Bacteroidales bacterium]|nr:M20/M25/M40 family metallo-hydrolase [Bacteroidales bacterium]MDD4672535.1 M20/M25/M40 family metallo-hydrolase [Bacteroidales bacterium]
MRLPARLVVILVLCIAYSCKQSPKINPEIVKEDLFAHVDFLASDSLMGRQPGSAYDRVAAKYIKDVFELNGLELLNRTGYQFLEFIDYQDVGKGNALRVNRKTFVLDNDYTVYPFSASDSISSPAVFVGYGLSIDSDTLIWNDYDLANATDKWAVILRGHPFGKSYNDKLAQVSSDRYKVMLAKDNGAAGVVFVSGKKYDKADNLISTKRKSFDVGIPAIHVKRHVADEILKSTGWNISKLENYFSTGSRTNPLVVGNNLCARTNVVTIKKNTQNVVGMITGSDPLLRHQFVVIGAHYDHLGMGGKGTSSRMPDTLAVHNGADDNASGVSSILEIAQKLAVNKPRRSVVVIAFAAEELGLLGSRFFVETPLVPRDSIVAMINIDMLGRLNEAKELQVGGVKTSVEFDEMLKQINTSYGFQLALSPEGYGPSDHASFYAHDIPVLFFSTGPHTDYHTPNDKVDLLNFDGMEQASNYIYDVVEEIASSDLKPTFTQSGPKHRASKHGDELKVRLGIMPDVGGSDNDGLRVLAVTDNLPAQVAGILKNDVITAIDGKRVRHIHDYMYRLQELTPGMTVSVEVKRKDTVKVFLIQL